MAAKRKKKSSASRIVDVVSSGVSSEKDRDEDVCVGILVGEHAPRDMVETVRDAFVATRAGGTVIPQRLSPVSSALMDSADLIVVVMGAEDEEKATREVNACAEAGLPVGVVVESALDAPQIADEGASARVNVIAASSREALLDRLSFWLVSATPKDVALAANFPFCRKAAARRLVARCARDNTLVAITNLKGANFPVMLVSQAKLALSMSAAYGESLSPVSLGELAFVVGMALVYRGLARGVVRTTPGSGRVPCAVIAYSGTILTGRALELWLSDEGKERLSRLGERLVVVGERVAEASAPVLSRVGERFGVRHNQALPALGGHTVASVEV